MSDDQEKRADTTWSVDDDPTKLFFVLKLTLDGKIAHAIAPKAWVNTRELLIAGGEDGKTHVFQGESRGDARATTCSVKGGPIVAQVERGHVSTADNVCSSCFRKPS